MPLAAPNWGLTLQAMMTSTKTIERLFPFIKRARTLIVGQQIVLRSKSQLHFVLLTHDISDRGKSEALRKFKHYPVVQRFRSADLQKHFDVRGAKLLGFRKSGLSKSLYAELKKYRINEPVEPKREEEKSNAKGADSKSKEKKPKKKKKRLVPRSTKAPRKTSSASQE
jgi:hypothetical protein